LKRRIYILLLSLCACVCASVAYAQTDTIRYVHPNGAYDNDGKSWETAMNRVQDAINDLRDYLNEHHLTSGSVYIAAGTYVPTESTESSGGSMLNTSFKIYGGIHVYGGFNPETPESRPGLRMMSNGKTCEENWADQSGIGTVSGTEIASQWDLRYKTILTGNHSSTPPTFTFDSIRGKYTTAYAANSYHVVWFATNGIWPATDDLLKNHYKPLQYPASIDGCVISSGNASSRNINLREHTGYGGGVYMVGNSSMRGCIVERCSANMRGGGIYADGGGTIEFCLIQTCQSAGIGVYQGYGGGVCIDHEGSIGHSQITSCASRCGGGIFISHVPEDYPTTGNPAIDNISNYSPHATACVVNNNTTNAEGAGIYLAEGGTVNHCTVTANNCMGPDVTYYGRRHGRTGGIYVRNCGQIFNSVVWGNRCDVNNDIQFASVRQKTGVAGYETFVYHTAFMNHDITDWTGVSKESVYSLDKQNMPVEGGSDNFPCFFSPTVVPLNWDSVNTSAGIYGAGVLAHIRPVDYPGPRIWHLTSHSYLDQKGVQYSPAMVDPPTWLIHAHTDYGVVSNPYEPASTLGALVRKPDNMRHALIAPQGLEGRKDATPIPTIFIDLHHEGEFEDGHFATPPYCGLSWEAPLHSIGDALMYYRTYLVEEPTKGIGKRAHYHLPSAWDGEGNPTAYTDYDYVQMLVKEGEQSTAGPNNYLGKDMRTASIRTLSHMRLYGGYPKTLTGTSTEGRDPLNHPTVITANIANEKGEVAYANNSAHVLTYVNTEYTVVDGFQLLNGNAHNLSGTSAVQAGGGVLVSNDKNVITDQSKRIDMVGNELRNCRLANNSAPKGAAIYVTGDSRNSVNALCYAELKVVNCIIRNNTADYSSGNNGVITANGRAFIDIDHCDIVNNVGYPLQSDNRWWKNGQLLPYNNGYIRVDNSIIYCNGTEVLNDRSTLASSNVLSVDAATQDYIFGTYNMFDADIQLHTADPTQPHGFFKSDFTVDKAGVLPAGMPANHPLKLAMPAEKFNQCNLTRTDRNVETYPVFVNPSRNIGHSVEGDRPLFGGKVSFIPLNNNPCVNAASVSAYGANNVPRPDAEDFDLTDNNRRNYGGEPDIGALEDADLPISGSVIYVTPKGAGKMDGSSWANAIAGNLVYQVGGSYVIDEAHADSAGQYITTKNNLYRGGYAVDYVWHTGTTNYVDKQTITQKRIDMTYYEDGTYKTSDGGETVLAEKTDNQTVTTSNTLTREKTEFIYGEKSGASRGFYRTNLIDSQISSAYVKNNNEGYKDLNLGNALSITNNREEDYVSGLQFAVEKAASINKDRGKDDRVQVWVGNGIYEDYKGYVMRDKVEVYGGFPAQKYKAPGMIERQALVSEEVPLSSKASVKEEEKAQYETILQVFDQRPYVRNAPLFEDANSSNYANKWAFNSNVILYKDKDFTESGTKTITTETTVTIPVYYRRDTIPAGGYTEYYEVPGGNVEADLSGRILNPGFEQNAGSGNWDATKAKYGWKDNGGFSLGGTTNHCAKIVNKTDLNFYQDIENLEKGLYRVSVQAFNKANARDNVKLVANGEERVLLSVASSGDAWTNYESMLASGDYDANWVDVFVGESGHLRIGFKGSYSGSGTTVFDNFKLERLSGSEDISTSTDVVKETGYTDKTSSKEYTTFRKPVLYMPDVCMSTYWPGTVDNNDNNYSNARRQNISGNVVTPKPGTGYVMYEGTRWDGFTIRNGFVYDYFANRDGGGGVRMFEGGTLAHCVVTDNTVYGGIRTRGGGGYCDGRTSQVIGCFFTNNLNAGIRASNNDKDSNGGGIYMLVGTCYNSLFANNLCWGADSRGAGIYIEQATFYNNTVAYNTCRVRNKTVNTAKGNGVHQYEGANGGAVLNVFNTIFYGNTGPAIGAQDNSKIKGFKNSYIQSTTATHATIIGKMDASCIIYNNQDANATTNPFALSIADAPHQNNFRLKDGSGCINNGAIPADFKGEFPDKDVDFANRIQDCQIDIGAYEFNAAYSIKPDTTTHPGQAIFYVTFDARGGDASASSPQNAACKQKLQLVLDAAGRYKYNLMHRTGLVPPAPIAGKPDSTWSVEVWLEGDDINSTVSDEYADWYTATRSTKHNIDNYIDNTLDYSFIIPHGVQIKGGYTTDFTGRDPLTYRTVLSGKITSSTGAEGNTFHVVTFTNDLFTPEETYYKDGDEPVRNQLAFMKAEKDRAVVDGLFIMDGHANSPDMADRIGAAAVVTNYAHIRNCVIQENTAEAYGGGLYLKPYALVSGTIIKHNTAETGGGIYVEAPASLNLDSLARVYSSTICENTARSSAGGMFFDNTYARVNSTALWHNEANDNANISGVFSRSSEETDYPLTFCAVESRRLEGQGNVELSPKETEGVRWDRQDPFNDILYYPIEMSSTLSRAGMTYMQWYNNMSRFTTLDSVDIAGVSRTKWNSDGSARNYAWGSDTLVTKNNDFIEIGARAINKNFAINVDPKYVMNRLYVMHTDLINSEAARALQDNTENTPAAHMYRQMGSCILNPFHRLGDAFDYIIAARKSNPALYRNRVFEVFIEQGIYYPYHNAYGEQDEVRNNTFLIPEGIYVIGGIDSRPEDHHYGQEGYFDMFTGAAYGDENDVTVAGYTIYSAPLDSIRLRDKHHRPMRDNNLNSVIEPWELERQTILSGNAVAGEDFTHVYHVITMHADSNYVGPQPLKFRHLNPEFDRNNLRPGIPMFIDPIPMDKPELFVDEIDLSILGRTTEFDGIQINGGYANHLNPEDTVRHPYVKKTYFRGGGIFVDGNWDEDFNNPSDKLPNVTEPAKYNIPIVVENSFFTNNMAGNGGAVYSNGGIYMYGCHFVQNYSQGPMTEIDQRFIPWTAGGCIATNAFCGISNTLFDNNEARRGLYPITVSGEEEIPHADARQGFGGVLSVASQARARIANCHFMKNKAVAYPSIYNFYSNHRYSDPDSMQFAFNTIFWGNEVFEVESLDQLEHIVPPSAQTIKDFNDLYKKSRKGVFHYDGTKWENYERLFHEYDSLYNHYAAEKDTFNEAVTNKLAELRAQGDELEGLYFCSYRKTYGPSGMKPTAEGYLLTRDEQRNFVDPRQKPVQTKIDHDFPVEDLRNLYSYVHGNNNTLINPINTATDGPNFKQPSFIAGIDGYMQNADWLIARMNLTTDQGWGHLKQTVTRGVGYFLTRYTDTQQFDTYDEALAAANAALETDTCTAWSVLPVHGLPVASFDDEQHPLGAIYNWYSKRYGAYMSDVNAPLPIKGQYYMAYSRTTSDEDISGNMDRISKRPKIGQTDTYIDVGIYEYQYVQLNIKGQEIDTMWVATKTKDAIRHDGLTWETPTTDLQSAIDVLMSSHNNHDKYVCFLGDDEGGTFSPSDVIDNRRAFIISSNTLEPLLPDSAEADHDYGVNSLTFLGGYSFDVKDAPRDPQAHPTIIEMPNTGTAAQRNQLFVVEDMTRQMVQANWQGEYTSRDSVVIPIVFDGITFINPYSTKEPDPDAYSSLGGQMSKKGGAAIYYRWQRRYEGDGSVYTPNFNMALHPDSALIDGNKVTLPKLTISNCIFMDNGARTENKLERSPAVRIDHGGGSSLIVNTLFHSNAGAPVYARTFDITEEENDLAKVPNDVIMVNITSALNDGHIRLDSKDSEVHNSLIWLDDLASDTTIQLQMGADQWDKTTNKDREGIADRMTHNAVWGCFQAYDDKPDGDPVGNNHPLSTDNNNILKGPGFVSPHVTATTSDQRRERSFRLNPSVRTHGMANKETYLNRVFFRVYPDTCYATHNKYWRRSNGFKILTFTDAVEELANDSDLAAKPRLSGNEMERGAYECLAVLQRVLYVDPVKPAVSAGDGSNWMNSFGQGQLQNAIDAAAVYTYLYQDEPRETRKAYVFVKGTGESIEPNIIEARDGVYVFGSLPVSFQDTAFLNDEGKFEDSECTRYVNYVRSIVSGVASENANRSKIHAIHVTGDDFGTGFLLDGFMITNPTTRPDKAAVLLNNEMSAVRNCIIVDNHVINQPVADVQRGLLYNCLFYNDSAQTIVKVGTNGLVLNNTIVANNNDVTPLDDSEAASGAVVNNISGQSTNLTCFAPYMTEHNPYTLPVYLTDYTPLSFQLHEHSTLINAGTNDGSLSSLFDIYKTDNIINFNRDRDILGNPRMISTSVDKGALETWRVEKNKTQVITALTNKKINREESIDADDATRLAAFSEHYGGNQYPHPGSVVYLMDSAAMTMQYETLGDFHELKNASNPITLRPGFMLLRPGASFYGNGHKAQISYVAAEKKLVDQQYAMTSFPYNYNTANITVTDYDDAAGTITAELLPSDFKFSTYQYNGEARSEKDYVFQTANSTLWTRIDTTNRTATDGYLMKFDASMDTVLRFNAFAPEVNQYVYTEDGSDKTISLKRYDHRTPGSGASLDFTRAEDMGWNMKGLPWLVSDYRTDTVLDGYTYLRQMHIPHVLYMMDGLGEYIDNGQVYSARSWDRPTFMSMGNAFLTQTATTQESETVTFYQPYFSLNDKKPARPLLLMRAAGQQSDQADLLTVIADTAASKSVQYTYGRDALKWGANDSTAQVYLMDDKRLSHLSILGAAPTDVDIPLGVSVPMREKTSVLTFELPEKDAFADYKYVWLIDYQRNRYINLLKNDYEIELGGGEYHHRFAIRIGTFPKTDEDGNRKYIVYTADGNLYVRGIVPGDQITVYSPTGSLVYSTIANANEFILPLYHQSGFIVRVNETAHKVVNW